MSGGASLCFDSTVQHSGNGVLVESMLVIVALGAAVAGFVQGLSGFAFGMVAMSFWAWTMEPRLAATLVVFGSLLGQTLAAFRMRRAFHWAQLLPFVLGGLCGIPLGVWLLPMVDMQWFKFGLGAFLVIWCPAMLMARHLPKITFGGRVLDGLIGLVGGVLGGLGGFTGTVPTLWCTLRGYPKDMQRAVIQNFNFAMLFVTMCTYVATGMVTRDVLPLFAVVAPAMLIPTLLGMRVYARISEALFRQVVLGLLTLSGVAMLASSIPELIARSH